MLELRMFLFLPLFFLGCQRSLQPLCLTSIGMAADDAELAADLLTPQFPGGLSRSGSEFRPPWIGPVLAFGPRRCAGGLCEGSLATLDLGWPAPLPSSLLSVLAFSFSTNRELSDSLTSSLLCGSSSLFTGLALELAALDLVDAEEGRTLVSASAGSLVSLVVGLELWRLGRWWLLSLGSFLSWLLSFLFSLLLFSLGDFSLLSGVGSLFPGAADEDPPPSATGEEPWMSRSR